VLVLAGSDQIMVRELLLVAETENARQTEGVCLTFTAGEKF
jgi:hypothetical protein